MLRIGFQLMNDCLLMVFMFWLAGASMAQRKYTKHIDITLCYRENIGIVGMALR
jgi:hypothetical protein